MKQRKVDMFERNGHELVNLALKIDSSNQMEGIGDRQGRSPVCIACHDTIVALDTLIRAVTVLLRVEANGEERRA